VSRLARVRVGPFLLEESVAPQDFQASVHLIPPAGFLPRLPGIGLLTIAPGRRAQILNGQPLDDAWFQTPPRQDGCFAALDGERRLLAVARRREGCFQYLAVFPEDGD
jgi:hypothetical protein